MNKDAMLERLKTSDLLAELFSRRVLTARSSNIADGDVVVMHYDERFVDKQKAEYLANKLVNAFKRRGKQVIILFVPSQEALAVETLPDEDMDKLGWVRKDTKGENNG